MAEDIREESNDNPFSFRSRKVGDSFHMSEKWILFVDIKSVMEME